VADDEKKVEPTTTNIVIVTVEKQPLVAEDMNVVEEYNRHIIDLVSYEKESIQAPEDILLKKIDKEKEVRGLGSS